MASVTSSPPVKSFSDPAFKQQLQQLRQTDNITNWFYFAYVWLFLIVVIGGTIWFYEARAGLGLSWWWNVPLTILAITLIGAGQHQLTGLTHEASHHMLFKNRYLNELASEFLCMFPMFSATHQYRLQHLAHHQFVNDPLRDPDVSQLAGSGHWLDFPVSSGKFLWTVAKQIIWFPSLLRYILNRARYNSFPTEHNPYLPKGYKPSRVAVRVGLLYLVSLVASLTVFCWLNNPLLLAVVPTTMWLAVMAFYWFLPARLYHQTRVHGVFPQRITSLMRISYLTAMFAGVAWINMLTGSPSWLYFGLLWVVPMVTSFAFYMVLRQIVQHGNGGRGWMTNTRVFFVNPLINFAVFPMGMEYHLPHHLFVTIPHYRLKKLHELLLEYPEYREEAVVVEGYFLPKHRPPTHPTVVDVLGPEYAPTAKEIYVDNTVLENVKVDEKADILREGEEVAKGLRQ